MKTLSLAARKLRALFKYVAGQSDTCTIRFPPNGLMTPYLVCPSQIFVDVAVILLKESIRDIAIQRCFL